MNSIKFPSAPGLAWQATFKNTGVKLELLTDIDTLLMIEKKNISCNSSISKSW